MALRYLQKRQDHHSQMVKKGQPGYHRKSTFNKIVVGLTGGILCLLLVQAISFVWLWSSFKPGHRASHAARKSDLIVVFPGDKERIQEGYALAKQGCADNLLIIGETEAGYKNLAKKFGPLPTVNLIPDRKSRSTFEDVLNARKVILENGFESILLVTSSYHMPRVLFLFKAFLFDSGQKLHLQYYPVEIRNHQKRLQLHCNEMIKFWGSILEMSGYAVTDSLLLDSPFLAKIRKLCQKRLYFRT